MLTRVFLTHSHHISNPRTAIFEKQSSFATKMAWLDQDGSGKVSLGLLVHYGLVHIRKNLCLIFRLMYVSYDVIGIF